jgi:hypothetical protein
MHLVAEARSPKDLARLLDAGRSLAQDARWRGTLS